MTVKISLLDLTVDQVEMLETEVGKPFDEWSALPSKMALYRRIYAMVSGADAATVGALTMRQMVESISLGDEDAETGNPTAPPSG